MDTVFLNLYFVVGVLALIACTLATILVVKNSLAPATTTPAGGAAALPTESVWKKVTDGLQSVLSVQTLIVMSVFASFEFALWKTQWFPHLFEGAGLWHIPVLGNLIYLTNLISEKTTGGRKTWLMRAMFVIFIISGASYLVSKESIDKFVAWWNTPSAPVQTARQEQTTSVRPVCDREIKTISLSQTPTRINPDSNRCSVTFEVMKGSADLTGPSKSFGERTAGSRFDEAKEVAVSHAVATTSVETILKYQICPSSHRVPGWC